MAPPSYTPYNPADHGPPSALLPEEVFGHVDVATLGDITRYLRESESQDDTELATWIQRNYLHGLRKDQSTATIRTPEGFAQLDRAYRRVRSLTNKAQDKWPFFDRNFKQMSTATVRNNARGEAAPGVLFNKNGMRRPSGLGEQPQASSTRNGVDTPKTSPGPQLQAPFGNRNLGRHQSRKQPDFLRPMRQTPVPLPSNLPPKGAERSDSEILSAPPEQRDLRQSQRQTTSPQELPKYTGTFTVNPRFSHLANGEAQDFFSESDGQVMPLSEAPQSDEAPRSETRPSELAISAEPELSQQASNAPISKPTISGVSRKSSSVLSEVPSLETVRDAGGGKVRGPSGRYLPIKAPVLSPRSKKNGKKRKERARMAKVKEAENRKSAARSTASQEPEQQSEEEQDQEQEQEQEQELQPGSPAPFQDEDVFADVQSPSPSIQEDTIEVHSAVEPVTELSEPAQNDTAETMADDDAEITSELTPESTPAYLLAAEADAVPSNLDRLPPNSRTRKRNSEPITQTGPSKKRKVGRPRKSEQLTTGESLQEQISPPKSVVEEVPQMTTRRTTRRSAAAEAAQKTPKLQPEPAPREPAVVQKPVEDDEDITMGGVEEYATSEDLQDTVSPIAASVVKEVKTAGQEEEAHAPAPSASKLRAPSTPNSRPSSATPATIDRTPPKLSDDDLLNIGLQKTSSPAPQRVSPYVSPYEPVPPPNFTATANMNGQNAKTNGTSIPPAAQATQPAPATTTNGAAPTHAPGHVEYFARIMTGNGMMEVPIAPEQLDSNEEKMIRKYAEWNAAPGAVPVPYAQFRQIFAFAIQQGQ